MEVLNNKWKADNYKFVGKSFDLRAKNMLTGNSLLMIVGEETTDSIDFELTGTGGYGEYSAYDGSTLVLGNQLRGFKTVVTPKEWAKEIQLKYKQVKNDKLGETRKVGTKLAQSGWATVQKHILQAFANAYNSGVLGGDGKAFAATDHPVASKEDSNRSYTVDTASGTYSNLITTALSGAAISAAKALGARFVTPDGQPLLANYNLLLVSPELEATAAKLLGPENKLMPTGDPDNENNAANPNYGMKYIVIGGGADGFTAKQWAICDADLFKETGLKVVYTTKPMVMQSKLDNPLIDSYVGYADYAIGWGDARSIIFSNPA